MPKKSQIIWPRPSQFNAVKATRVRTCVSGKRFEESPKPGSQTSLEDWAKCQFEFSLVAGVESWLPGRVELEFWEFLRISRDDRIGSKHVRWPRMTMQPWTLPGIWLSQQLSRRASLTVADVELLTPQMKSKRWQTKSSNCEYSAYNLKVIFVSRIIAQGQSSAIFFRSVLSSIWYTHNYMKRKIWRSI